ncbi:MAG TPA: ATP-binding protein [Candidatus Paceibacterota bacterium]|nr:ATP-binding protein [Candidatus Paceibacterota bacterium]
MEPYALLFILYFIVGRIGLSISAFHGVAAYVWLSSAVALCALILQGYRLWPAILCASFALFASSGLGLGISLLLAAAHTLESLACTYALLHIIGFRNDLKRQRDNIGIAAVGCIGPSIGATLGALALLFTGAMQLPDIIPLWVAWWSGSAMAIIALLPFLLKWLSSPRFVRSPGQYTELALALGAVFVTSLLVFWTNNTQAYYLGIPLTWIALRAGPRGMSSALAIASVVAIFGTLLGAGPYGDGAVLGLNIFFITTGSLFLIFTSIVEERKGVENELAQHVEELEQALSKISSEDEAKRNFLAILAHELRNPLAAILSSVELLRLHQPSPNDAPILVRTIGEHVNAMRSMLDDVLDISRISRNKLVLRREVVALTPILERSAHSAEAIVRTRHHRLVILKPAREIYIDADPIRIEQILVNLLNNAAKYTNPGGTIEVRLTEEKNMAALHVKDNGIGISKSMQKRIFEPFFQVRRGKLATEGLGVGLPLTRQLVEMHNGSVEVGSAGEGKGSEFIVRLPLVRDPIKTPTTQPIEKNRKLRFVKNTRSILVVDDNEAAAQALTRLLELRGHNVRTVYNGTRAVDEARKDPPDIIVLDIGLPDIDGYEVVRQVLEDPQFPSAIVALTGYGQAEDKERALNAGFHYHLTKPVGLKELEKAFKKVEYVWQD